MQMALVFCYEVNFIEISCVPNPQVVMVAKKYTVHKLHAFWSRYENYSEKQPLKQWKMLFFSLKIIDIVGKLIVSYSLSTNYKTVPYKLVEYTYSS